MADSEEIPSKQQVDELRSLLDKVAEGAGREIVNKTLNLFTNLINSKKFGFTTSEKLAYSLENIGQRDSFKRLKQCVGNHWAMNLIRVGIHISELNDEGQRKMIEELRGEVFRRSSERGIRVLNIGATRTINSIINYLSNLKIEKNLSQDELGKELDQIINNWNKITIFVKKENSVDEIHKTTLKKIESKFQLFFVFAYGSAREIAIRAIAKLNNEKKIYQNDYIFNTSNMQDLAGYDVFTATFRLFAFDILSFFLPKVAFLDYD